MQAPSRSTPRRASSVWRSRSTDRPLAFTPTTWHRKSLTVVALSAFSTESNEDIAAASKATIARPSQPAETCRSCSEASHIKIGSARALWQPRQEARVHCGVVSKPHPDGAIETNERQTHYTIQKQRLFTYPSFDAVNSPAPDSGLGRSTPHTGIAHQKHGPKRKILAVS